MRIERGRCAVTGLALIRHGTLPRRDMTEEAVEDLGRVERARRALGVVLHRLDGQAVMAQALDRAVVEVALADEEARPAGSESATTSTSWFCAVTVTRPLPSSRTGWLAAW